MGMEIGIEIKIGSAQWSGHDLTQYKNWGSGASHRRWWCPAPAAAWSGIPRSCRRIQVGCCWGRIWACAPSSQLQSRMCPGDSLGGFRVQGFVLELSLEGLRFLSFWSKDRKLPFERTRNRFFSRREKESFSFFSFWRAKKKESSFSLEEIPSSREEKKQVFLFILFEERSSFFSRKEKSKPFFFRRIRKKVLLLVRLQRRKKAFLWSRNKKAFLFGEKKKFFFRREKRKLIFLQRRKQVLLLLKKCLLLEKFFSQRRNKVFLL